MSASRVMDGRCQSTAAMVDGSRRGRMSRCVDIHCLYLTCHGCLPNAFPRPFTAISRSLGLRVVAVLGFIAVSRSFTD